LIGIKTFPLRLTDEFHKEIKIAATKEGISIHDFIVKAVLEKLGKTKEGR